MNKKITCLATLFLCLLVTSFYNSEIETVKISFSLRLNHDVYEQSLWGNPPQLAIWLVNTESGEIFNVLVTHRTANNDWVGKATCPVSLPFWELYNRKLQASDEGDVVNKIRVDAISGASIILADLVRSIFRGKQNDTRKKPVDPQMDAISGATPRYNINRDVILAANSVWIYYIEVNCSGDYNEHYRARNMETGETDLYGNGQPSIVYKGEINTLKHSFEEAKLAGKSDQHYVINEINESLDSITSAKELIRGIIVSYK